KTGTFIVPGEHQTYLVHCDIAQHMEKGMKGQLVVGRGSGDLWSIPGVSNAFNAESYLPGMLKWIIGSMIFATALLSLYLMRKKSLR
ncbi:MAG: multicopper oxidase domain-containing protein, partial [Gammaproteobacteria bacterium]|nr:multicopper oxidase domain-containing protein [Gammaproteobacteria bacterium]